MLNAALLIVIGLVSLQPVVPPAQKESPPQAPGTTEPKLTGAAGPLTDQERALVGKWGVDIDGFVKVAKEQPDAAGMRKGASDDQIATTIGGMVSRLGDFAVHLNADRSAVVVLQVTAVTGTWKVEKDAVVLSGDDQLTHMQVRKDGDKLLVNVQATERYIPRPASLPQPTAGPAVVPMNKRPDVKSVTVQELNGTWTLDEEASIEASNALYDRILPYMPEAMKTRLEARRPGLRQRVAAGKLTFTCLDGKVILDSFVKNHQEGVVEAHGDAVLLRMPGASKTPQSGALDFVLPFVADQGTLRMSGGDCVEVFKKRAVAPGTEKGK